MILFTRLRIGLHSRLGKILAHKVSAYFAVANELHLSSCR